METNRLHFFLIAAQTQNLRKAAEILHISHSALSKSLKLLQEDLGGKPLFLREGRGIVLTRYGQSFIVKAATVLKAVEGLSDEKSGIVHSPKSLCIATFEVFSTYFTGRLAAKFFKGWELSFIEATPGQMERLILERRADVAITYEPIAMLGLTFRKITSLSMHVYASKKLIRPESTWQSLPFSIPVIPLAGAPSGAKGLDGWNDAKFPRRIIYRVELLETALALAREGLAAVCAPDFAIRLHNESCVEDFHLVRIPGNMPEKITRSVFLIQLKGDEETPAVKKISAALRMLR